MRIENTELVKVPKVDTPSRVVGEDVKPPGSVKLLHQVIAEGKGSGEEGAAEARQLEEVVSRLNLVLEMTWYDLRFRIHEASKEIMVQVVNRDTGEVLREIPPKEILDMVAEMKRLIGMLLDKKV